MRRFGIRRRFSILMLLMILSVPFNSVFLSIISSAPIIPEAQAATWVTLPTTWMNITGSADASQNWIFRTFSAFTANVEVTGVTGLFAWEFKLSWNASLLDFVSVTEGSFLQSGGTTNFHSEVHEDEVDLDYILVNCTLQSGSGVSGSGVIATVDFDLAMLDGSTPLDLYETAMWDSGGGSIVHGVTDGYALVNLPASDYLLMYMLPQTNVADPGEMFNVTVWIDQPDLPWGLYAWGFTLWFNRFILEATNVVNYVFLEGGTPVTTIDNLNGKVLVAALLTGNVEGTFGSGRLATITFTVEGSGRSSLNLVPDPAYLIDPPTLYEVSQAAFDGLFRSSTPVAAFSFTPQPPTIKAAVNQTILFNATASSDPGGLSIVSYAWDFGDDVAVTESDPITYHAYTNPGSYTVNLTVTNSEGKSATESKAASAGGPDVVIRDIAVTSVRVSHKAAMQNTFVNISVTVRNDGTDRENFLIEAYVLNQTFSSNLGSRNVTLQREGDIITEYFIWDTNGYDFGNYEIQGIVPELPGENYVNNNEIRVPIKVAAFNLVDYPTQSGSVLFHVFVESNSTLPYPSPFTPTTYAFNQSAKEISFNVTGSTSAFSYCNVTIRKALLSSQPLDAWTILFDGVPIINPTITENDTHTFLYFNFTLSEHKVQLIGTLTGVPPTAAFTVSPTQQFYFKNEILTFNATDSHDPDGQIISYFFRFGDGANATGTPNYDGTGQLINVTWVIKEPGKSPQQLTTTTPIISHNFTTIDTIDFTFNATLTVTDDVEFNSTSFSLLKVFQAFDMAITDIVVSEDIINITEIPDINVTIINKLSFPGTLSLRFNVTIYGNGTMLASQTGPAAAGGTSLLVSIPLNTTNMNLGAYMLNATVRIVKYGTLNPPNFPSEDPDTLADNTMSYGFITVKKFDSTLSIQASSASPTYGSSVIIKGQLTPLRTEAMITLESKLGQEAFVNLTAVAIKLDGEYQYVWNPTQAGTYQIRARWLGDAITSANVSATLTVIVKQVTSTVSLEVSESSISLGSSVSLSGTITPSRASVEVTVYYRTGGGEWAALPVTTTDTQSSYSLQWEPTETGTYEIQAKWAGDVNTVAGESDIKTLEVTGGGGWPMELIYAGIVIAIVVVAVLAIYFLKLRKK